MNFYDGPLTGADGGAITKNSLLSLGAITLILTQSLRAEDKYWNGSGNHLDGVWTTSNTWWSLNAAGTITPGSGVYGGDRAIFSTQGVNTAQTIKQGGDLQAAGLRFIGPSSTALQGGGGNRTLTLFGSGIQVESGAGAVTIGSATEGQKLNLTVLPGSWTNHSASPLTIQNNVKVSNYGTLSVAGSGAVTVNGSISQNETVFVEKSGAGVLSLSGANTYKGSTTVRGGTLVVNGNQDAATGILTVSGEGTRLAGSGTIGGNTTIQSKAIHSPGAIGAVGRQTFDQAGAATTSLTYNAGSIFAWNLDTTQKQTRGIGYDAVDVTGTLGKSTAQNLPGQAVFRIVIGDSGFTDHFWSSARTWSDIFTNGSSAIANWTRVFENGGFEYFATSGNPISPHGQGSFSLSGNSLSWTPQAGVSFVPEPSAALVGFLIAAGLLRRGR